MPADQEFFRAPSLESFAYYNRDRFEANYIGISSDSKSLSGAQIELILHERAHAHLCMTSIVGAQYLVNWVFAADTFISDCLRGGQAVINEYAQWIELYSNEPELAPLADRFSAHDNLRVARFWMLYVVARPMPEFVDKAAQLFVVKRASISDTSIGEIWTTPLAKFGNITTVRIPVIHVYAEGSSGASSPIGEHLVQELLATILGIRSTRGDLSIGELNEYLGVELTHGRADPFVCGIVHFAATINAKALAGASCLVLEALAHLSLFSIDTIVGESLLYSELPDETVKSGIPEIGLCFSESLIGLAHSVGVGSSIAEVADFFARKSGQRDFSALCQLAEDYLSNANAILRNDFRGSKFDNVCGNVLKTAEKERRRQRIDFSSYLDELPMRLWSGIDVCLPLERFDDRIGGKMEAVPLRAVQTAQVFDDLLRNSRIGCIFADVGACRVGEKSILSPDSLRPIDSYPIAGFSATCSCPGLYHWLGEPTSSWIRDQMGIV